MNINKQTEAYFIEHCDNENCCLGSFNYTCPCCDESIIDYEIWWLDFEIWSGKNHNFNCENCNEKLIVFYDKEEMEYFVRLNQDDIKNVNLEEEIISK